MNPLDNKIIKRLFEYAWPICYYNQEQAMEMMCDWLYENGFDAHWKANSIYINGIRCLAASFSHEERNAWALYTLRVYNGSDLKKIYTSKLSTILENKPNFKLINILKTPIGIYQLLFINIMHKSNIFSQ